MERPHHPSDRSSYGGEGGAGVGGAGVGGASSSSSSSSAAPSSASRATSSGRSRVGGGFGDGIHSLLEPAAWGCPVIFGPLHTKFPEAQGLIDAGGGPGIGHNRRRPPMPCP